MIYGYIRVSSDKQTTDNQRYTILEFAHQKGFKIDEWIDENVSTKVKLESRKLGQLLKEMQMGDILVVTELSRLGRNLMEVMSILHTCMEKEMKVYTIKEGYELGDNISSKVLAFAFSLSAEIERKLISQRTKEALARKKAEGKKLGRPHGSFSKHTKLSGKEEEIRKLLEKKVSFSAIGRIFDVHRLTVKQFAESRKLMP